MNTAAPRPDKHLLRVENLRTHLPTDRGMVRAVDGVSFKLNSGKTLGIVGESGCGKSVLCRALLGLLPKTAILGEDPGIFYNGENLVGLSEKAYNKIRAMEIAMIFQDPLSSLNPVMTIGKQIAETLIYHKKIKPGTARSQAIDMLQSVGVPGPKQRVDQYPHQLSGGMRQRVAISIALACEPKLLIADEPTTALDVTVQEGILDLLGKLQTERQMAMILVTHDLNMAATRAHDIAVMYAGRIVEQAPAATLFSDMCMPYTRALIGSIPRLDNPPHTALTSINGHPPDLLSEIEGCAFAPRCFRARKLCHTKRPFLLPEPDNRRHLVACRYPIRGPES